VIPIELDPVIHQATRLRIMAALFRNREASFRELRDGLALTDGNLGSHAAALEKAGYLASRRALAGLSFEVRYRITASGAAAFVAYTEELRALLDDALADAAPQGEGRERPRDAADASGL
jgi:DNA-binding MarR family transcriptional regulator